MKRVVALALVLVLALGLAACVNMQRKVAELDPDEVARATARVKYIAHRGYCLSERDGVTVTLGENTEASFRNAAANPNFWGIETDVWQTKDGLLVCMHDKDAVEGIADVHAADSADVLSRPLRKAAGYYAPTFQTYLDVCREGGKVAVVELKDVAMSEACMDAVLDAIRRSGVRAVVISFFLNKLEYVRSRDDTIECMLLFHKQWKKKYRQAYGTTTTLETMLERVREWRMGVCVETGYLYDNRDKGWVEAFHRAGLAVNTWTVDDPYRAIYDATALGVDCVISNLDMGALVAAALQ